MLKGVYGPAAYFERVKHVGRVLDRPFRAKTFGQAMTGLKMLSRVIRGMGIRRSPYRRHFWRIVRDCLWHNPKALESVLMLAAFYAHLGQFSQFVIRELDRQIDEIDREPAPLLAQSA